MSLHLLCDTQGCAPVLLLMGAGGRLRSWCRKMGCHCLWPFIVLFQELQLWKWRLTTATAFQQLLLMGLINMIFNCLLGKVKMCFMQDVMHKMWFPWKKHGRNLEF